MQRVQFLHPTFPYSLRIVVKELFAGCFFHVGGTVPETLASAQ